MVRDTCSSISGLLSLLRWFYQALCTHLTCMRSNAPCWLLCFLKHVWKKKARARTAQPPWASPSCSMRGKDVLPLPCATWPLPWCLFIVHSSRGSSDSTPASGPWPTVLPFYYSLYGALGDPGKGHGFRSLQISGNPILTSRDDGDDTS